MLQNMPNTLLFIRKQFLHLLRTEQAFHKFRDVESGLHVKIRERVVRVIKTARIVFLELIGHLHNDTAGRKDLVRALRRNVIEYILSLRLVKVICERTPLLQKCSNRIIKDGLIKELSRKLLFLTALLIQIATAVSKETKFIASDTGDFKEHFRLNIFLKVI